MTEQECLARMVPPGAYKPGKYGGGVIQVHVTRACDKACHHCTQGSNFGGKNTYMTPEQFEQACISLKGFHGVTGMFGGNPAMHPWFDQLCIIMRKHIPFEQSGLWCNNPLGKGHWMRETFNPKVSNLNCHQDKDAYAEFKRDWPESMPFGQDKDSRHAPVFLSMKDLAIPESERWELISKCDINQHWSAMIGVFRGQLRAWFCEVAGAQAMLHQDEPDYPDTGLPIAEKSWSTKPLTSERPSYILDNTPWIAVFTWNGDEAWSKADKYGGTPVHWWQLPMFMFGEQVRNHCHECGVPLRGYGLLANEAYGADQITQTHSSLPAPKKRTSLALITDRKQIQEQAYPRMTDYLQNARS